MRNRARRSDSARVKGNDKDHRRSQYAEPNDLDGTVGPESTRVIMGSFFRPKLCAGEFFPLAQECSQWKIDLENAEPTS